MEQQRDVKRVVPRILKMAKSRASEEYGRRDNKQVHAAEANIDTMKTTLPMKGERGQPRRGE